jgi:hypothetical protein
MTYEEQCNGLDPRDPADAKALARIEQEYPHAITIRVVPCDAYTPARVEINWYGRSETFDISDAKELALSILAIVSAAEGEHWDRFSGRLFEGRQTAAEFRRRMPVQ